MGIKFVRENNNCERCRKFNTEVGATRHYTEHDLDMVLCESCIEIVEVPYHQKCSKCNELVWKHGGRINYEDTVICKECHTKILKKKESRKKVFDFVKRHWAKWIGFGLTLIFGIIAIVMMS